MPRPVKICERYKRSLERLKGRDLSRADVGGELIEELKGLCEAIDQTAERLYRLERLLLAWSGTSRDEFERARATAMLPADGSAFAAMVHASMQDEDV